MKTVFAAITTAILFLGLGVAHAQRVSPNALPRNAMLREQAHVQMPSARLHSVPSSVNKPTATRVMPHSIPSATARPESVVARPSPTAVNHNGKPIAANSEAARARTATQTKQQPQGQTPPPYFM